MKYEDGTILEESDLIALYPRRIEKKENYEVWQHPYTKGNVLENEPDFQLVFFNEDGSVDSYHVSHKEYRFKDLTHLGKLQLIYHDITLKFNEYTHLIQDVWSSEPDDYFSEILKKKQSYRNYY